MKGVTNFCDLGGIATADGFMQDVLDVGPNEQAALRELLLEPATA